MQRIEKINLSNLKKCNQIWDDMTPTKKGRICQKCEHTIIDFRDFSDREMAETHTFTKGKVCGLYHPHQLQSVTPENVKKKHFKTFYLAALGLISTATALQAENNTVKIVQTSVDFTQNPTEQQQTTENEPKKDSLIITGILTEEAIGDVIIGGTVHIKGTKIGTSSNVDGRYFLDITEQIKTLDEITLVYSYLGHETVEIVIDKANLQANSLKKINVVFKPNLEAIAFYVSRPPLHKRIWYKIKGVFQ